MYYIHCIYPKTEFHITFQKHQEKVNGFCQLLFYPIQVSLENVRGKKEYSCCKKVVRSLTGKSGEW